MDSQKRKWINDLLQAITPKVTTAEQLVMLESFYEIAHAHGSIEERKAVNEDLRRQICDINHSLGHPFHAGQRQAG